MKGPLSLDPLSSPPPFDPPPFASAAIAFPPPLSFSRTELFLLSLSSLVEWAEEEEEEGGYPRKVHRYFLFPIFSRPKRWSGFKRGEGGKGDCFLRCTFGVGEKSDKSLVSSCTYYYVQRSTYGPFVPPHCTSRKGSWSQLWTVSAQQVLPHSSSHFLLMMILLLFHTWAQGTENGP